MRINYVNFQPPSVEKSIIEHEFKKLERDLDLDASVVINIKYDYDKFHGHATILQNKIATQSEMEARKLDMIAPSLVIDLRAKLAWQYKKELAKEQSYAKQL